MSEHRKRTRKGAREAPRETSIERARIRRRRWVATSSREDAESLSSKRSTLALVKGYRVVVVVVGGGKRPSIRRRIVN